MIFNRTKKSHEVGYAQVQSNTIAKVLQILGCI